MNAYEVGGRVRQSVEHQCIIFSRVAPFPVGAGRVPSSFCRSVCLSVGHDGELWKNGRLDRDEVWSGGLGER